MNKQLKENPALAGIKEALNRIAAERDGERERLESLKAKAVKMQKQRYELDGLLELSLKERIVIDKRIEQLEATADILVKTSESIIEL